MTRFAIEHGSFRDRESRIFYGSDGTVFRGLSQRACGDWERLSGTNFYHRLVEDKKITATSKVDLSLDLEQSDGFGWAGVLRHETLPFISYPYEWTFGMLKDAALLHLEILEAAISEGMILKDASPYNIQWLGTQPQFIDIGSFESFQNGELWVGYRQFCQMFLNPLILQAYREIPFQPWLRGSLEGIKSRDCWAILSLRDLFRPLVFGHVFLHAKLQRQFEEDDFGFRHSWSSSAFNLNLMKSNLFGLRKGIKRLNWNSSASHWTQYSKLHSYSDEDWRLKKAFVSEILASKKWNLTWDLGCNTGSYSRLAAHHSRFVLALDSDQTVIESLYQELKIEGKQSILPLLIDVSDGLTSIGWRSSERRALDKRKKPDLVLCLAFLHHAIIESNIALPDFIDWLHSLGAAIIIEFVSKEDPMVRKLLSRKRDQYADYDIGFFEKCLAGKFFVLKKLSLGCQTRFLYYATVRN